MPVPCTEDFMADVRAWEDVNEDEDEEAMKLQYYGITDIAGITGKARAWVPGSHLCRRPWWHSM